MNHKNLGYGQGNHQGILEAKGEYFLVLNPDVELYKGNLDVMLRYMDQHEKIGVLSPQLIYEDGTIQDVLYTIDECFEMVDGPNLLLDIKSTTNNYVDSMKHTNGSPCPFKTTACYAHHCIQLPL